MSDVASLSVALHLNSAAFKTQITDAYKNANKASKDFTDKATSQANELAAAIARTGAAAQSIKGGLGGAAQSYNGVISGAGRLNFVLHQLAAGSNLHSSTIINALIPALESLKERVNGSTSGWKAQQEAARNAAAEMKQAATEQITLAQAEKQSALSKVAIAEKSIAAAQAQREQAFALDEYFEKQAKVNALHGVTVSYEQDHIKNERAIAEANLAEAAAIEKLKAAKAQIVAAELAETEGKAALVTATEAAAVANTELSITQRVAATSSTALRTALGLLGGPVGVGLSLVAAAGTLIWHEFKKAEDQTKQLNSALLDLNTSSLVSAGELRRLNAELGDTDASLNAVTAAAKAGFSGEMLRQVATLGAAFETAGGSAQEIVNRLSALKGDPITAMQNLASQGVKLSDATMQQVLALKEQGNTQQATQLVIEAAIKAETDRARDLGIEVDKNTEAVKTLADTWGTAGEQAVIALGGAIDKSQQLTHSLQAQARQLQNDVNAATAAAQADRLKNTAGLKSYLEAGTSAADRRAEAIKKLNNSIFKPDTAEYKRVLKGINDEYDKAVKRETPKTKASSGQSEGQRMLERAREQQTVLEAQAKSTDKMTSSAKELAAFDQKIASLKGEHLSKQEQSLVDMQGQIRSQLQINVELEREAEMRKLSAKYQKETASWAEEVKALQAESSQQVASLSMSDRESADAAARTDIINRFNQRRLKLEQDFTDKNAPEYQKRLSQLEAAQDQELAIVQQTNQAKLAAQADYSAGFSRGMQNWLDSSRDVNSQMANFASSAFDSMTDALTSFVTTGKMNFRSFTVSILSDLAKIAMRMAVTNAATGLFGSFVKSAKGNVFSSPGLSSFSNSVVTSPTMFAFAHGAGLMGEAGPEAVMPLTRGPDGSLGVRAAGSGSTVINVNAPVTLNSGSNAGGISPSNTASTARQLKSIVESAITDRLRREMAPGGVLYSR